MALLKNKLLVCLEGNIASGKSSILNTFKRDPAASIYPEPVDEWRNYNGTNLLEKMYNDPEKYMFPFQTCNIITMDNRHNDMRKNQTKKVRRTLMIMERCPLASEHVFISNSVKNGFLDETQRVLLKTLNERINGNNLVPDMVIYVKTNPHVAFERIKNRKREEESKITIEFIKDLDTEYETYISLLKEIYGISVFTIDGNKNIQEMDKDLIELKMIMENLLNKKIKKGEEEEEEEKKINSDNEEDDEIIKTCLPIPHSHSEKASMWNYIPFFNYIFSFIRYLLGNKNPEKELKKEA
ncbi:UNVERIFIED_CONTAM: hypothetical protein RMT77_005733 [Armadillidium vulgare]